MISANFLKTNAALLALKVAMLIILALAAYIAWLLIDNARLETKLANQDQLITAQNAAVTRWKDEAEFKQRSARDALEQAEKLSREADERIKALSMAKPETCGEGIELIDKALGL